MGDTPVEFNTIAHTTKTPQVRTFVRSGAISPPTLAPARKLIICAPRLLASIPLCYGLRRGREANTPKNGEKSRKTIFQNVIGGSDGH